MGGLAARLSVDRLIGAWSESTHAEAPLQIERRVRPEDLAPHPFRWDDVAT